MKMYLQQLAGRQGRPVGNQIDNREARDVLVAELKAIQATREMLGAWCVGLNRIELGFRETAVRSAAHDLGISLP